MTLYITTWVKTDREGNPKKVTKIVNLPDIIATCEAYLLMNNPEPNPISRYLSSSLRSSTFAVFL